VPDLKFVFHSELVKHAERRERCLYHFHRYICTKETKGITFVVSFIHADISRMENSELHYRIFVIELKN